MPKPSLHGAHQTANAARAGACASRLTEFAIDGAAVAAGLAQARWPARLQRLTRGPLVDATPNGWELWLDGGHNPAAGVALAETLKDWHDRPLDLIYGMLDTKVAAGYLEALAPQVRGLKAVRHPGEAASLPAEPPAAHATRAGNEETPAGSGMEALQAHSTDRRRVGEE